MQAIPNAIRRLTRSSSQNVPPPLIPRHPIKKALCIAITYAARSEAVLKVPPRDVERWSSLLISRYWCMVLSTG